jgi:hypothetical protein
MRKADLRRVGLRCILGEGGKGMGTRMSGGMVGIILLSKSRWLGGVDWG